MKNRTGFTILEMLIATMIGLIVLLALGRIILTNQSSWRQGREKVELQTNATEAVEWMARRVRGARLLTTAAGEFSTFGEDSVLARTYRYDAAQDRILEIDGDETRPLVDQTTNFFTVTPNPDRTSLTLELELEDRNGNRVAVETTATLRNTTMEF